MDNKKPISEMTNEELVNAWNEGSKWTSSKMDSKNPDDFKLFQAGLKRIEALEDEMIKRGIDYGRTNKNS